MTAVIYILSFLVLLGVLVTIHEFGHFIVARMCNVYVQSFSIGMGPVIYKKLDKQGTEFRISAFLLGGYVSMITNKLIEVEPEIKEKLTEEQIKNTFDSKPKWQRACIMFAGPLANFILSIFIFSLIFLGTPDPQTVAVIKDSSSQIQFQENSGQYISQGDEIISVNSKKISDPKDLNLELLTYAGFTGFINLSLKRNDIQNPVEVNIYVEDFLPSAIEQANPLDNLGLEVEYRSKPIIGNIIKDGPADIAGLMKDDEILFIDDNEISYAEDIRSSISKIPNSFVSITLLRENQKMVIPLQTGLVEANDGTKIGILGISFGTQRTLISAISKGIYETYNLSIKTLQFIGKMLTGNMGAENLSGPIGIAQMAGNTAQAGFIPFMYLMALLSISLGVLNLLPIPVLDGGQLTMLGIEAIRGKPLPEKAESIIYTTGGFLVVLLMIFAIFNDVARFL